ncbi:MAG: tetraacyldisaccharide 4'-kinase [Chlorobi bacterium]|nr:tetraacyldisaccharide 4'-kinase [Chlorobiota bacterium]
MIKLLLYPFSLLYGIAVYVRNRLYDYGLLRSTEFDLPIISIGNITVGGTGKTPHTEYLIELLKGRFKVATLSRGYKRETDGFLYVEADSTVAGVGDEPLQMKRKFPGIIVSVCNNRVAGVKQLMKRDPEEIPDVVLLDDAFQHRRITPGVSIVLIDYNRPIKKDTLLPAGRLREGKAEIRRANIIIMTKCPREVTPITRRILQKEVNLKPYQSLFFTTTVYGHIRPVFTNGQTLNLFFESELSVLLVTGIASTISIKSHLNETVSSVEELAFDDHHYYTQDDIALIMDKFNKIPSEKRIIVTTEKDSMRFKDMEELPLEFKNAIYYLPIKVKFLDKEGATFNQKIINYVGENKSNLELHKRKKQL